MNAGPSEQNASAGDVPALQSVDAIVIYDPEDGRVRHIHHVFVLYGGTPFDRRTAEKAALVEAEALGHRVSSLKLLHVPDFRDVRATYRVDVAKQVLVRIPRSTRVSRAGSLA